MKKLHLSVKAIAAQPTSKLEDSFDKKCYIAYVSQKAKEKIVLSLNIAIITDRTFTPYRKAIEKIKLNSEVTFYHLGNRIMNDSFAW